jgi:hypothetical protein
MIDVAGIADPGVREPSVAMDSTGNFDVAYTYPSLSTGHEAIEINFFNATAGSVGSY